MYVYICIYIYMYIYICIYIYVYICIYIHVWSRVLQVMEKKSVEPVYPMCYIEYVMCVYIYVIGGGEEECGASDQGKDRSAVHHRRPRAGV